MTTHDKDLANLEVHIYQISKPGRVKEEHHGYLCGESIDQIKQLIAQRELETRQELAFQISLILDENDLPIEIKVPTFSEEVQRGLMEIEPFRYAQLLDALSDIRKLANEAVQNSKERGVNND